ncbi:MAG: GDSL-type esterase/lipase family protein [Bryobacteraceae bacterium]
MIRRYFLLFSAAASLVAQAQTTAPPNPLLPGGQLTALCDRMAQLMDSAAAATPELLRAGAPVRENFRQALGNLKTSTGNAPFVYSVLTNSRAFLALADVVPKPFPYPEEARRQLAELRDAQVRLEAHFRALVDQKESLLRGSDRDNLARYSEANQKLPDAQSGTLRIVFLGDSITDGWRLNEYFPERDFINRGISGQITGEMLGRTRADVIDLRPAAVVILAGTNDLARKVPLITIENNYAMIADLCKLYGIKVFFTSVLPVSDYHKAENPSYERTLGRPPVFIRALNDWLKDFCVRRGFTYVDYYSQMVDQNGQLKRELADDGLHPNAAGYRIMAPIILNALNPILSVTAPAKPGSKKRRQ